MNEQQHFQWSCHPRAESLALSKLGEFCTTGPELRHFADRLATVNIRLVDIVDHLIIEDNQSNRQELEA